MYHFYTNNLLLRHGVTRPGYCSANDRCCCMMAGVAWEAQVQFPA